MRLVDLEIRGFGKLSDRTLRFDKGTNVIYGPNEAGKSTLHTLIRAMFFGLPRARGVEAETDTWACMKPWKGKRYGAVLRIEENGHIYSIERDFEKDPVGAVILDETTMEAVAYPDEFLQGLLCNLTPQNYDNTISIGQLKSEGDESMAAEVKQFIVNMNTTGNRSLNCDRAKGYLFQQKRDLAEQLVPDAARTFAANATECKQLEAELSRPEYISKVREIEATLTAITDRSEENDRNRRALSEQVAEERQLLEAREFSTSRDAQRALLQYRMVVEDYQKELAKKKVPLFRFLWILFLLLGIFAGIASFLGIRSGYFNGQLRPQNMLILEGCCAFFLFLGILFLILTCVAKSTLARKKDLLDHLMKVYEPASTVTSDGILAVDSLLQNLYDVALDAEAKDQEIDRLKEERVDLARQETEENEHLHQEKDLQKELMKKILRLNALRRENEALKGVLLSNDRINDDIEAMEIALSTIDELAEKMRDSFGVHLNKAASAYIRDITGGIYDSMDIDNEFHVWMNAKDKMVPLEQVSSGTADQVYLAVRLAVADLMNGDSRLPLIFDDSFVNYDEKRLGSALSWICRSYGSQLIIFTCHELEGQVLRKKGIDFQMIRL